MIAEPCVDVMDRACVAECPVEAIYFEDGLPERWRVYAEDNARFFGQTLPSRGGPPVASLPPASCTSRT